ncbi:1,4-dihydroxy-2-naphthoate polyprenyltransferase [Corynebacterium freiburgense]|uniref:1,4-dihydroxy-2-naphthoate polyprenyltransferase n=1 Tax=Corynebacterium freiburgense TaxID=556548 RepID=UPI001F0A36CA|nr:1,4-dihydroxy-2-naphthoate polyprenyltransferase [Corynebacterium freiburgense]
MSASLHQWFQGARPHTWANAFAPVVAGTGAAASSGHANWWRALLACCVAWALIVGVNYANDYSDGIRGTDDARSGPVRLTASGLATPQKVRLAAFLAFGVACIAGTILAWLSSWWLILVGAICILAAWFYTGGKNPYGYRGLGEVSVLIFFGFVAVCGTEFTQTGSISPTGIGCAIAIGCFSSAVNLANNLRDIPTDAATGKLTLAVRLGDQRTRTLWMILILTPYVVSICLGWKPMLAFITLPLTFYAARPILRGARGAELIPVLGYTGRAMLLWSVVTALTLS